MDDGYEVFGTPLSDVITAATVVSVGIVLAIALRVVVRRAFSHSDSSPDIALLLARFVQALIIVVSLVYGLNALGIRITPLLGALGITGIAIALAVQSILTNAFASILLQIRRPFRRGDQIGTNDYEGVVDEVNLRTVRLRTFDGNDVLIPASQVLDNPITNYTHAATRRTDLEVGVEYDSDLELARSVLVATAVEVEGVQTTPPPEAWVTTFGDNAITIVLRYWHASDNATLWRVRSAVAIAVKRAYDEQGLVIAFPQRVLHLSPEAATALAPKARAVTRR